MTTAPDPPPDDEAVDAAKAAYAPPPSLDDLLKRLDDAPDPKDEVGTRRWRRREIHAVIGQLVRSGADKGTRLDYRAELAVRKWAVTCAEWDQLERAALAAACRAQPAPAHEPAEHPYSIADGRLVVTDGGMSEIVADFVPAIVADIERDDGAERTRAFRVRVTLPDGSSGEADVTPAQLGEPVRWAAEAAGARAVIRAIPAAAQHVRAAAQLLAPAELARSAIFVHTGWTRRINGRWHYLTATGALGADGTDGSAVVQLPGSLGSYAMPNPTGATAAELPAAVRASLAVLDVAPDSATVPVLAAAYRAPLPIPSDGAVYGVGPTGTGKSQTAALAQQHFGPAMDGQHLPAGWGSTGNALADQAFRVADALLVIDDYVPGGSAQDMAKLRRTAEQVLRGSANGAGRDRLDATATLRTSRPPRAQILATGEDLPPGQSLRGRLYIVELGIGDMQWDLLSERQAEAAAGTYALAMAGYVRWLARRLDDEELTPELLTARRLELRHKATGAGQHRRTPDMIASLALGWAEWLDYALAIGAITQDERDTYSHRVWKALIAGADTQAAAQAAMAPAQIYRAALISAVSSGRAYLAAMDGGAPEDPVGWGWEVTVVEFKSGYPGADLDRRSSHRPRPGASRIGWVDGPTAYLDPEAAYAVVVRHAADIGLPALVGEHAMRKRLDEAGLIVAEVSGGKRRLTVSKTVDGKRHRGLLHLAAAMWEAE